MEDYYFWQDFFDAYQSLSDPTKALWLIVPPALVLGLIALVTRHRFAVRQAETGMRRDLVYTIHRDGDDKLHVYRHGAAFDREPALEYIVLDMDSSLSPTHGTQEGTAWNGHFGCMCYHPLFVFNQLGQMERCALRHGNVHSAADWEAVLNRHSPDDTASMMECANFRSSKQELR